MIQKYLPYIILAVGAGIIFYMNYNFNTGCCNHKDVGHNHSHHGHTHAHEHKHHNANEDHHDHGHNNEHDAHQ